MTDTPPPNPTVTDRRGDARRVAGVVEQACSAYGRHDLLSRVGDVKSRLERAEVHVVVAGEFKQGKSSLVNALLNTTICAVDDDIATAVPTFCRFGDSERAAVLVPDDVTGELVAEPIDPTEIRAYATETARGDRAVRAVQVELPRRLLAEGLVVVDTPGVGGLGSRHAAATIATLAGAALVVLVTDASQELTRAEIDFLHQAVSSGPEVVLAVTKTDFYPAWRRVVDLDQGHLRGGGHHVDVIALSSSLRQLANRTADRAINAESGFPALVERISRLTAEAARDLRLDVCRDLADVAAQLEAQFRAEKAVLDDPASAQALVDELIGLKERTDALRGGLARWNQTLNDGIADLVSDVDHDLRFRMRKVLEDSDTSIEGFDPADSWNEFEPWLYNRVGGEVVANYALLRSRAAELAVNVAELFQGEGGEIVSRLDVSLPANALAAVTSAHAEIEHMSIGRQGMAVMRNFYSSALMFTMFGSLANIALGPWVVAVGLVMGRRGLKDEKERQLTARRAQAKNAVRRHSDDVSFHVGKDSRDTLRRVQRQLRDHYSARAEELHRSTSEALKAAQQSVVQDQASRERRLRDVEAELRRLGTLRAQIDGAAAQDRAST